MSNPFRTTIKEERQTPFVNFEQSGGKTSLLKGDFQSPNFATGEKGWKVNSDGQAEFTDLQVSGFVKTVSVGQKIQDAIDYLNAHGGGEVRLDAGTHTLTDDITIYSGVSLVGAGRDNTILEFSSLTNGILMIGTSSSIKKNMTLKDFTLQNSNNTAGIDVDYSDFFKIENVRIHSCDQKGLRIQRSQEFIVSNFYASSNTGNGFEIIGDSNRVTQRFTIINCRSSSNGGIGYSIQPSSNQMFYGTFTGCRANSNTGDGFDFTGTGSSAMDLSMVSCIASANGGIGFDVDSNCQRVKFLNCIADTNTGDGFESDAIGTSIIGCYSSTAYDINSSVNFIGNDVAGGASVDPKSRIDMANGEQFQSFMNLNENTRTIRKYIVMKNTVGTTIAAGSPVIINSVATGDEVVTTTTSGDDKVIGVADAAITNNEWGRILVEGYSTIVRANGTTDIAIGDFLTTDTNAGIAKKAAAGDMAFAIALEAYSTDDTAGVIDALIIQPRAIQ